MIQLNDSGVFYDRTLHHYYLNGKRLDGITKMLRKRKFPMVKPKDIPEEKWNEMLRVAGERGSAIHDACECYDNGINVDTEYMEEVLAYAAMKNKKKLKHLASEYIVTDGFYFASPIDKVFEVDEHTVDLGDIKTPSKLEKEYVSWQLSIYAYLFERQNPDIKVRDLLAIKVRNGKCSIVKVPRIPNEQVQNLMADEIFDAPVSVEIPTLPSMPDQYKEMQWDIREMMEFYVEAKEKLDAIRVKLLEEMDAAEVTKWQGDMLTFTRKADATCEEFDKKRFKEEHPDLYREYTMITNRRGSVSITINK